MHVMYICVILHAYQNLWTFLILIVSHLLPDVKSIPPLMDMPMKSSTDPLQTTSTVPLRTASNDPLRTASTISLLTTPTLHQLDQFLVRQVALDWYTVGIHLEIEVLTLQIIEADIHPPSVERCCRTMFTKWLSHDKGTGGAPRLWRTVLKALKNVGYTSLVGDVERTLNINDHHCHR